MVQRSARLCARKVARTKTRFMVWLVKVAACSTKVTSWWCSDGTERQLCYEWAGLAFVVIRVSCNTGSTLGNSAMSCCYAVVAS